MRTVLGAEAPPEEAAVEEWMLRLRGGRLWVREVAAKQG